MKVEMLSAKLKILTKEFEIIHKLPLIQVFQVVGKRSEQDGYGELRRDVEENGFIDPIVVIENTYDNYNLAIRRVTKRFVRPYINAYRTYLCMYGNQRIDIALDLRIFHLNAILAPNVEWAHAIQLKLDAKPLIPIPTNTLAKTDYTKRNL
jgi:hypothetical protein